MHEKPWKLVLAFSFFGAISVGFLIPIVLGLIPLVSMGGVMMMLAGGFTVSGLALLPPLARRRGAGNGPNGAQWCFLALGLALWCAAPVLQLIGTEGDLSSLTGSGAKAVPLWFLIVLTWGTAVLLLVAGVRQYRRAKTARGRGGSAG